MYRDPTELWEREIQPLADDFVYPPTPDLVTAVAERLAAEKQSRRERRLQPVWVALALLLLLLAGTLSIPVARATLLDWLQVGAVRIWLREPTPTATGIYHRAEPTTTPISSLLDIAGETTLSAAQTEVDFPIQWPTWPADLGEPDHVYLQQAEGDMVILVWMWPTQPAQVRMSLHLLGPNAFVWKIKPPEVVDVQVNGTQAFWMRGTYYIKIRAGQSWGSVRLVDGHVLIWTEGEMTYRLESDLSLAEAIQAAESLGK